MWGSKKKMGYESSHHVSPSEGRVFGLWWPLLYTEEYLVKNKHSLIFTESMDGRMDGKKKGGREGGTNGRREG